MIKALLCQQINFLTSFQYENEEEEEEEQTEEEEDEEEPVMAEEPVTSLISLRPSTSTAAYRQFIQQQNRHRAQPPQSAQQQFQQRQAQRQIQSEVGERGFLS